LNNSRLDPGKAWKIIISPLPTKQHLKQLPTKLQVNDDVFDKPDQIETTLNQYLCKIGRELTDKFPHTNPNSFLK